MHPVIEEMQKVRINKNAARVKHLCFIAIVPLLYIFIIEILRHARGKIYASAVYFQAQSTDSGEPDENQDRNIRRRA